MCCTVVRPRASRTSSDKVINRPRHGLYVDDFMQLVTEPALRRARHLRGEYLDATRAVGWVAKPAKMIDFTARPTDLLGILFDGVRASYGLSPDKIAGLIARTLQLCEVGSVTMAHLRAILGSWCWALLVRRPAFSVLEHVFGQLDPLARPQQRVQLWRTSVRELLCLVDLAPLLRASLGAPWFDTVFAVDASEDGLGGVLDAGKKVDAQACAQLGRACFELASGRQGRRTSWSQGLLQDFAAASGEGRHAAASASGGRGRGGRQCSRGAAFRLGHRPAGGALGGFPRLASAKAGTHHVARGAGRQDNPAACGEHARGHRLPHPLSF